jgi:predicted dinucleotide-binding enzyme
MHIAIIGSGFIGTTLGRSLAAAGHEVTFGSRHAGAEDSDVAGARTTSIPEALERADVVILAVPGPAVSEVSEQYAGELDGKLVIDATNQMAAAVANARASLPGTVRYARAFNTLGGENFADPVFEGGRADLFFSSLTADRSVVEEVIEGVGLRPIFVGEDQEELIDALFRLWIALALTQGRGRRLALRLLEG